MGVSKMHECVVFAGVGRISKDVQWVCVFENTWSAWCVGESTGGLGSVWVRLMCGWWSVWVCVPLTARVFGPQML